jgi:hypothetical protein
MKNKIAFALISSVAVAISSVANIKPAQARARLGGLNLTDYCRNYHPRSKGMIDKFLNRNDAYSWICYNSRVSYSIDMQHACRTYYGAGAYAHPTNRRDAYSWQCFR